MPNYAKQNEGLVLKDVFEIKFEPRQTPFLDDATVRNFVAKDLKARQA